MNAKNLFDRYQSVVAQIDGELDAITASPVVRFVEDKWDAFLKRNCKLDTRELADESNDVYTDIHDLAFVHGFLIGQMFDFKDPDIAKNLKPIKADFVQTSGLKILPKKKAA